MSASPLQGTSLVDYAGIYLTQFDNGAFIKLCDSF
jgi:hypothetical protein